MSDSKTPSRKVSLHRDLTQGSIPKNLLQLSWPMIVMEATYMVSQIWDMLWVGRASGASSIAALGIGSMIMMLLSSVDLALISGARAMVARFVGARDFEGAKKAASQSLIMAVCWGLVITIFVSTFARDILNIFGMEPAVVEEGVKYLRIIFAGWISLEILIMSLYTIQATGDSFNPMVIEIFMRIIHLVLTPLLVLGVGILPVLGITGAALSNVIAQCFGATIGLWMLFTGFSRIKLSLRDFKPMPSMMWRVLKIGFWSMISMLQSSASMFVITTVIVPFGTQAIAANGVVGNIQGFIITPNLGLGGAVGVLVGQNLGAKHPDRAVKSTWYGAAILEGFLLACGAALLIWAERIGGCFVSDPVDPQLIAIGAAFLRISTVGYLVMGLNSALMNCITGAGDTFPNMIINIALIWAVQVPLTYYLAQHTGLGVYGIRWAMVISLFAGAIAYFLYFQSGRWKHKKV
jgi:putative MATE family efflux protein